MFTLETNTIPDAWFQLVYNIFDKGFLYRIDRGSFEGSHRLEYDFVSLKINKPDLRPLVPEFPVWMNCEPPATQEYVDEYFQQLLNDTDIPKNTVYTYGLYLNSQIEEIIDIFKKNKNTNQCCATIGDISSILLDDPPCLKVVDFRIKLNKLQMYVYFRSNDLFAGFPVNIAGLQMLKEYMCCQIGCEDGPIYYSSKGLHLYDHQFAIARKRVGRNKNKEIDGFESFVFKNTK
jgi:thymidylate synthase